MRIRKFKFKKVTNTNDTAIRIIKQTNLDSGMVISEFQKKGKGQYGRKWISLKGNLFVSFFFNINNTKLPIKRLTKINCYLIKKTIANFYKKKIIFKPPNDLLINNKKICGILQETIINVNKKFLIIGIGVNINKSPTISNYPTTNLFEITGKKFIYKLVAKSLKLNFEKKFLKILKKGN